MKHDNHNYNAAEVAEDSVVKPDVEAVAAPEGAEPKVHPAKGVARTEEMKAKQAESMKARWADPAYRAAVAEGRAKAKAAKTAKAEAAPTTEVKDAE